MANDLNLKISAECPEKEAEKKYNDWEIKDAAMTIMRAEEIKQDAEMMALIQPELQKKVKAASEVAKTVEGAAKVLFGNGENKEGK